MMQRRSLALPEGRVSYLERGVPREGEPTLVLLHGLMGTALTFAPLLDALPAQRHVLAIDLPGAGDSDRSQRTSPSLYSTGRAIRRILDALGIKKPILLGYSHGGAVALHIAASEPDLVCALVLLAPAHPFFRHADQIIAFYLSPLGKLVAHTLPWYPRWVHMVGLRRMAGPQSADTPERLVPYRENLRTRGTIPFLLRLLRTWHSDMRELRHLLEAPFRVPTLLLWGDHDRAVPVSTAPDLVRRLQKSQLEILPGVGHRPAEECPGLCAHMIEQWLEANCLAQRTELTPAAKT